MAGTSGGLLTGLFSTAVIHPRIMRCWAASLVRTHGAHHDTDGLDVGLQEHFLFFSPLLGREPLSGSS